MTGVALRQNAVVAALAAGGCHSTCEIAVALDIPRGQVANTLCRLISRGYAARHGRGCFELTPEGLQAHKSGEEIFSGPRRALTQNVPRRRRRETARDKIWNAARILRKFSIADIEEITGAPRTAVARYLSDLERAGYLAPVRPGPTPAGGGNGVRRWAVVQDTGFLAPSIIIRKGTRIAFDRNTQVARPIS